MLYSNCLYSQKKDWTLFYDISQTTPGFPKVSMISNMFFKGMYSKPVPNSLASYNQNTYGGSTLGVNSYCNDAGSPLVNLVSNLATGTDVYASGTYVGNIPEYDDEVGIFQMGGIANNQGSNYMYHLIVADKVYSLSTFNGSVLNSSPIDLKYNHTAQSPSVAYNEFEGGFCSNFDVNNPSTFKVYIVQRSYIIDPNQNTAIESFEVIENIISSTALTLISQAVVCTLATNTLSIQNGIVTGYSNQSYSEMEFYDNKIAVGENNKVHVYNLTTNTAYSYTASETITGLEFDQNHSNELFISYENAITPTTDKIGISSWNFVSNSFTHYKKTDEYCKSQIETGLNKDFYVISNITSQIRGYNTQMFSNLGYQQYCQDEKNYLNNNRAKITGSYRLPDQIDGWDYKRIISQSLTSATFSLVANKCNDFTATISPANVSGFKYYYDADCKILAGAFSGNTGTVTAYRSYPSIWVKYMDYNNNSEGTATIKLDLINANAAFDIESHFSTSSCQPSGEEGWDCIGNTITYTNISNNYIGGQSSTATYQWDLGNNVYSTSYNAQANTYTLPGAYDITLIATTDVACIDISIVKIHIGENILKQVPDICSNMNLNLDLDYTPSTKGGDYTIDNVPVSGSFVPGASIMQNQANNPHTLQYTVCGTTTSCQFNVYQAPATPTFSSSIGNPANLCPANLVTLTTNANDARWYNHAVLSYSTPTQLDPLYTGHTSASFTCYPNTNYPIDKVEWIVCDRNATNGCLSDPAPTITIQYSLTPYTYATNYDVIVCKGSSGNTNFYACENDPQKPLSYCNMGNFGQTTQWYKNGVQIQGATNPTLSINNSTATSATYYYIALSKFGACPTQSSNYTVHVPDIPIITANPGTTLQPNGNTILAFTNSTDFQSINWYYNGKIISNSPTINVTIPGKYTAEGISSCGNYTTDVNVGLNCGNNIPLITITVSTTYNTPTTLFDVTINSGATLTVNSTTLTMQSCAKITVKTGGNLVINGSKLIGCSEWAGITVEDGGTLTINAQNGNNTEISGAYAGIYYKKIANGNGTINVQYCDFGNNTTHVILINKGNVSTFANCNFYSLNNSPSCANAANIPSLQNSSIRKQIYVEGGNDAHFTQCTFEGQVNVGTAFSRYAIEGYNLTTSNANKNLEVKEFNFNGTYTEAIHLNNCKNVNIEGRASIDNIKGYMSAAVYAINGSKVTVKLTRIGDYAVATPPSTPPITNGIFFDQTDECTVDECKFHYCKNGMQYYNSHSTQAVTNITKNVFFHNQFGLVMASTSYPYACGNFCNNTNTNVIAMNIGCNNFMLNNVGIYGCGALLQIGTFGTESGNIFKWSNSNNNNVDWDFLWDDLAGNNPQKSIYLDNTYYTINNGNPSNTYPMNSVPNFTLTGFTGVQSPNSPACRNASRPFAPNISPNISNIEVKSDILVSPNPFGNAFSIKLSNYTSEEIDIYNIELLDILGRSVLPKITFSSESVTVDCSQIPAGAYMLRCTSSNRKQSITKLIKVAD